VELKPGSRWRSAVCDTEVVVVRAPAGEVALECGGHPMLALDADRPSDRAPAPGFDAGAPIGKRFEEPELGLEVLVSKGGAGSLSVDGTLLAVKGAKPLPSSD
jgi:hypothetical protein